MQHRTQRLAATLLALGPLFTACATLEAERERAEEPRAIVHLQSRGASGEVTMAVPPLDRPLLHVVSLTRGLGSNDVGLDRGQLGPDRLVEFRRHGDRLLLVAPNLDWRSSSDEAVVRDGTTRAFAESVLWSFPIHTDKDGVESIRLDEFLLQDAHGIGRALADSGQGTFRLDRERSLVLADTVTVFPENAFVEVLQTFAGERPGREVRATTPAPDSVTLRIRHAFVVLPDLAEHDYEPRAFHPRSGYFSHSWNDSNAPLGTDTVQRVLTRHHVTEDEPLVYYVDRAAPEPMRTALLEGARFWEPVFDEALFPGAFRVELLPEGADPDDVRWNIVQWVERSTRGWSYGSTLIDPRTGEILKGHVTLGALRVRQDVLLFEGLIGPWSEGTLDPVATEAALARIRQLSAHEIGHTIGLAHNFAASRNDRASVMDYPAPRVGLDDSGAIDLSDAYAPGCGAWDLHAIRYGYGRYADEAAGLAALLDETEAAGLRYATDADARGLDRAHPLANLWDEGDDAVARLALDLRIRALALSRFGDAVIDPTRARSELERTLVPLYLRHRFQVEAVARLVGGRDYRYTLAGEAPSGVRTVDAATQRRALEGLFTTLGDDVLTLPRSVVERLEPPAPGTRRDRETFRATGPLFDPLEAAAAAVDRTLSLLLEPTRAARLVDQVALDPGQLGLEEVLNALARRWYGRSEAPAPTAEVVRARLLEHLFVLATDAGTPDRVRARALVALDTVDELLGLEAAPSSRLLRERLRRFRAEPQSFREGAPTPRTPPGSPIGAAPFACTHDAPPAW